jgi:hypothetical protein
MAKQRVADRLQPITYRGQIYFSEINPTYRGQIYFSEINPEINLSPFLLRNKSRNKSVPFFAFLQRLKSLLLAEASGLGFHVTACKKGVFTSQ